jgi:hypothetical protein
MSEAPATMNHLDLAGARAATNSWQNVLYTETRESGWDPETANSLAEEILHMIQELTDAFNEIRAGRRPDEIYIGTDGKPRGVPIEFADTLIGLFYNAELRGFSLFDATQIKRAWNRDRRYREENRHLHRDSPPRPS